MGCSASTSTENGGSFAHLDDSKDLFNGRQRRIVRKTWRPLANDMTGIGSKVFLRIFELNPTVKQLFPCRDLNGEELQKDLNFKGHASRFMQSVGAAVDNLDNLETSLAPLLTNLGRSHIHFRGFESHYFDAFTEAMMYVWEQELQDRFTSEVRDAWKMMFEYMMGKMKVGYIMSKEEQMNETNSQKIKTIE